MQNIMLRRRAGTDAPYLHRRQHRDAPLKASRKSGMTPEIWPAILAAWLKH